MAARTPTLWNPKVLISFWTFQTVSALVIIGLLAWAAVVLSHQDSSGVRQGLGAFDIYTLFISSLSIILMIAEAVLYKKNQLRPTNYLTTNVIKTTLWTVLLIIELLAAAFASFDFIALVIIIVTL
ncbi:MAG: hypothetical protein M1835_005084 [Candelina submexicana]|nr:MAG: hypothetical protein M1835_005084 [Candelina submexicana]